jgi:hypothetical protein
VSAVGYQPRIRRAVEFSSQHFIFLGRLSHGCETPPLQAHCLVRPLPEKDETAG